MVPGLVVVPFFLFSLQAIQQRAPLDYQGLHDP